MIYIDVHKDEHGIMLFIFPYDKAVRLSNMFLGTQENVDGEIGEEARSAICEIGNICACAYLNAISKFLDVTLIPSPPGLAIDMLKAIMEFPASLIGQRSEYAVVIETKFIFGGEAFPGLIMFMIDPPSQELILKRFGLSPNMKV